MTTSETIRRIARAEAGLNLDMFGYWPSNDEILEQLEATTFDFPNLPQSEAEVVQGLQFVLRQIELVSVILRFVDPRNYGILSPPVEQVLGIGQAAYHRENYRTYARNLRTIRDRVPGLSTAAEVDMALWVLSLGVVNRQLKNEPRFDFLLQEYKNDLLLRAIRVENLTSQLFGNLTRLQLAEALNASGTIRAKELAGQIAGIEFEKLLKTILNEPPDSMTPLSELLRSVRARSGPASRHRNNWQTAVRLRNKLIHNTKTWTPDEVGRLIEYTQQAEGGRTVDSGSLGPRHAKDRKLS